MGHVLLDFGSIGYWDTAEFFNGGKWHLFQTKTELHKPFGAADTNILNSQFQSFGQWRDNDSHVIEPAETSLKILNARRFVAPKRMNLFSDPMRPNQTIISLTGKERSWTSYGRPLRILCQVGDAVGISLDDGDKIRGYCKQIDLSTQMPTQGNRTHAPKGFGF